ncbi:MAG: ABC transporter ATP-binding protein [Planctomycetes bacterium]|nr:ABC transporter ATP-binding protein [Planctomycetota bacterium]
MIEMKDLCKSYEGTLAVRGLTLQVEKGDIYGFIGPNGAGKTTTIRMLATLLPPSSGEAKVCGFSVNGQSRDVRRVIGYMPDSFGVYEEMRVDEYLEFFAAAYGIRRGSRQKVVKDILELVDLWHKREDVIGNLSRGTQQRLGLARVLVHDPQVLLLDEPASGLDPRARIEIRELIRELGKMGKTILISSHILPELGDLCNKVGIIEKGGLVYSGPVSEIARKVQAFRTVVIRLGGGRETEAEQLLGRRPEVTSVKIEDGALVLALAESVTDISFLPELLVKEGYRIVAFREDTPDLEDAFMRLTKGIVS